MTAPIHRQTGASWPADPSRIAIFQALNLGDLLCTTPALRAIRGRFPAAEITFIGRPWAEEPVARLSTVDRFLPFPGYPGITESPTSATQAVSQWPRFDLAIQMHGSGEVSNGFVAALEATHSVGFGPPEDRRLTAALNWVESEPEPLRWLRLADAVGAAPAGLHLEFPVTAAERAKAAALIGPPDERPAIGLHTGSSNPSRRWPAGSFAELGDRLAELSQARIVLTGSNHERSLTASVCRLMKAPAIDLAGMTDLGELAAVVSALDLLVTNDTGASHLAAATRTPSIILFGPTRPERWAPLDRRLHQAIDASSNSGAPADGAAALHALRVDDVLAGCLTALASPASFDNRFLDQERIACAG
jgi:ADP-heptose:LPS heptosyltransferase